jgi:hypothetical protein
MWNEGTSEVMSGLAVPGPVPAAQEHDSGDDEQLGADHEPPGDQGQDGWTHLLVLGVPHDWDLLHFDARYEHALPGGMALGAGQWS